MTTLIDFFAHPQAPAVAAEQVGLLDRLSALRAVEVYRARLRWVSCFVETFRYSIVEQCALPSLRMLARLPDVPLPVLEDERLPGVSHATARLFALEVGELDENGPEEESWLAGGPTPERLFGVALSEPTRAAIDGKDVIASAAELSSLMSTLEGQHQRLVATRDALWSARQGNDAVRPQLAETLGEVRRYADMDEPCRATVARLVWSVQAIAHLLFGGAGTYPISSAA